MTIAFFLSSRRRALGLCALSVGLHVAALWWTAPRIGAAGTRPQPRLPVAIQVRLVAAPSPAAPELQRVRKLPATAAKPAASGALASRQGGAAETVSDIQSGQPTTVEAGGPAIAAAGAVAESAESAEPQPALPAAAPLAQPQPQPYRVDMPPSASITLDVARTDADGTAWSGEAVIAWRLDGDSYRMRVEAGVRVLVTRINLVVLESEGKVGETGFAPATLIEKRRGRAPTTTHFSERDGRITFSNGSAAALLPGAQDKATLPLQLAAIARAGSGQIDGGIEVLVGEDRDASLYRFVVLGQELLDTRLGKLPTWHLSRPPRAGAYGSRLDIWLAPDYGWYPVQIRNIEASGAVTTQTANKIVITDAEF